jgi:hypothetical protein
MEGTWSTNSSGQIKDQGVLLSKGKDVEKDPRVEGEHPVKDREGDLGQGRSASYPCFCHVML